MQAADAVDQWTGLFSGNFFADAFADWDTERLRFAEFAEPLHNLQNHL